jgi:ankyrin repeat protein
LITQDSIVLIQVSLVTEDEQYLHPYILKSNSNNQLSLSKKDMLNEETNNKNKYQYFYQLNRQTYTADIDSLNILSVPESKLLRAAKKCSKLEPTEELKKYGNLNKCKLKLEAVAFSIRSREIVKHLTEPIFTNIIENCKVEALSLTKKATLPLEILCVSKLYAKYHSDEEIFVLTSYIEHDDIVVEFLQCDLNDREKIVWLKVVQVNHSDVFHNCALVFTPPVYDFEPNINKLPLQTKVCFRLFRPSTKQYSELKEFYFLKDDSDFLNNYSTDFLKICATNSKLKTNKPVINRQSGDTSVNVLLNTKEGKTPDKNKSIIEEDSPRFFDLSDDRCFVAQSLSVPEKCLPVKISETMDIDPGSIKNEKAEFKISDDEDKSQGFDEVDKKKSKPADKPKKKETIEDLRKMLDDCEKKMNGLADRTSNALLNVSETRSLYNLIGTQRYLLSVQNEDGNTPLHVAILNSNFDILELFVDVIGKISDHDIINMTNNNQLTPLLLAAHQKESEVCAFLLETGAKINPADSTGSNCFHIACKNNDIKLLEVLLKHIQEKKNKESIINKLNYDGFTPLHIAVRANAYQSVELLIQSGICRINEKSPKDGMTALHYSSSLGVIKTTLLLLRQPDIIVDFKSYSGLTPLHIAVMNRNYFVVRKLIAYNAGMFEESRMCMNLKCAVKSCHHATDTGKKAQEKEKCKVDINMIRDINKDLPLIIEYSSMRFNAYHYAYNDELMYYLFKNEKIIPKDMLNRILIAELKKSINKASDKQLQLMDMALKEKLENDGNFDVLAYVENRMKEKNEKARLTKIENFVEKQQEDSLDVIYNDMCSLSINEKTIPSVILDDNMEQN